MPEIIFSDTIVIFKKTEKIFFVNNFCGPELYIEISQITERNRNHRRKVWFKQIFAAQLFPNVHSGKSHVKKITALTFQQFVPTSHGKLRSLNQQLQVWVSQELDFAFRAAINMSYREIIAKRVTISFLSLTCLKTCFSLVNNNEYWQKRLTRKSLNFFFKRKNQTKN